MKKVILIALLAVGCSNEIELPAIAPETGAEYTILPFGIDVPNHNDEKCATHTRFWGEYNVTRGGKTNIEEFKKEERPYPAKSYIVIPVRPWYDFMVHLREKGVVRRAVQAMGFIINGTVPVQWREPVDYRPTNHTGRGLPSRGLPVFPLKRQQSCGEGTDTSNSGL